MLAILPGCCPFWSRVLPEVVGGSKMRVDDGTNVVDRRQLGHYVDRLHCEDILVELVCQLTGGHRGDVRLSVHCRVRCRHSLHPEEKALHSVLPKTFIVSSKCYT